MKTDKYSSLPGRYYNGNVYGEVNGNNLNSIVRTSNRSCAANGHNDDKFEIPLPFGFHMDLDFLRFCCEDQAVSSETLDRLKDLRKARRKQRKELEALMGMQREQRERINQHMYNINKKQDHADHMQSTTFSFQHNPHHVNARTSPIAVDLTHSSADVHLRGMGNNSSFTTSSEFMKEALMDFEQCLQGTVNAKSKYNTFPRLNQASEPPAIQSELRDKIEKLYSAQSNSSISSISTNSSALPYQFPHLSPEAVLAGLPSSVPPPRSDHMETDSIGSINSEMSTTTLRTIREQMARSLAKLKEYEKQVEAIPVLQVKLSVLKEEKRLLMLQLKQREFQLRRDRGAELVESDVPLDLMEDTEDDFDFDHQQHGSKPRNRYLERPRARSESPFAKSGRVKPEEFISVRRQRSTSCGYNSDGSDYSPMDHRQRFYYSSRQQGSSTKNAASVAAAKVHSNNSSQERSEVSFYTGETSTPVGKVGTPPAPVVVAAPVATKDAASNTVEKSQRERATCTDPPAKVRTANHGTSTVKVLTFPKGTSTQLNMQELVSKDEMDARIQEAIFKTEEEIMGCPLLQKAMAKVEEEAIKGEEEQVSSEIEKCDVQCQVGDENLRPFVINVGLQCKLVEDKPAVCLQCEARKEAEAEEATTQQRFLKAIEAPPPPPITKSIGVGEYKLVEDDPDRHFRDIGVCTEKWVEVIKASKQTDTEDFAFKDTESPRVADMVFEPSPERVVLQRRSSLRKTSSPTGSRRSSVNSPLTTRKSSSNTTTTSTTKTKSQATMTETEVKVKVPTRDAKTGGPVVTTRTVSTGGMMSLPLSNILPAQGSPLTTPETEHPSAKLKLCDKCNNDIQKVAEGILHSPRIHAPPSPDLPWLSKIPRPVPENPTVHKLKAATSTGNLLNVGSPKSPVSMQRSKSNLTPSLGRKALSPSNQIPRRDLGTPPPHPLTPNRVSSPLARSQSPYSEKKSMIPKLSGGGSSGGVKRGATVTSTPSGSGSDSKGQQPQKSLIPRVETPPALRKMYPKDGSDKLATPDRNVVRKNTYTKDMAGVANPDLEKKDTNKKPEGSSRSSGKKDDEDDNKAADDGNKTDEEVDPDKRSQFPLPGSALFAPIDSSNQATRTKVTPSKEMCAALKVLNDSIARKSSNPMQSTNAVNIVQQEWFKISSTKGSNPLNVEDYLDFLEADMSKELLSRIVNLTDVNGNTALHYSVSHGNFDVVSVLLDSKVANPNILNKAGYTCVMLISLAQITNDTHRAVVRRLFSLGDVNIRATQHGQTALMLAVSHGRLDMVQLLVESGADLNIRDEDGSTALMCAAEHGQTDTVKYLIGQPDVDIFAKDNDGLTALAVAMEAGHRDLGVVLYANMSMSRGASPYSSMRLRGSAGGAGASGKTTPSSKSKGATPPRSPIAPTPPLRSRRTSSNQ